MRLQGGGDVLELAYDEQHCHLDDQPSNARADRYARCASRGLDILCYEHGSASPVLPRSSKSRIASSPYGYQWCVSDFTFHCWLPPARKSPINCSPPSTRISALWRLLCAAARISWAPSEPTFCTAEA